MFSTYKKSGFWTKKETGQKDEFTGLIYDCKPITNVALSAKLLYSKNAEEVTDLRKLKDMVKPVCEISGSWLHNIIIDNKKYWDIDEDYPDRQKPCIDNVLPSDWRYREDLIWVKYSYKKIAHKWKVRMEEQQRHERRLRQKRTDEEKKRGGRATSAK
jgi:hypothetical protein